MNWHEKKDEVLSRYNNMLAQWVLEGKPKLGETKTVLKRIENELSYINRKIVDSKEEFYTIPIKEVSASIFESECTMLGAIGGKICLGDGNYQTAIKRRA